MTHATPRTVHGDVLERLPTVCRGRTCRSSRRFQNAEENLSRPGHFVTECSWMSTIRPSAVQPRLTWFSVEGYKAFKDVAKVELGKITLLLGRNNAGKTALCFAPVFLTHPLRQDAKVPFPTELQTIDFGPIQSVAFRRQPTGFTGQLGLDGSAIKRMKIGATSLPEKGHLQLVTSLEFENQAGRCTKTSNVMWANAKRDIAAHKDLASVPESIVALRGLRPSHARYHDYLGYTPQWVGAVGEHAPMILAAGGDEALEQVNSWFEQLRVRVRIEPRGDAFEILASGKAGEPVNLLDSGAGIAQILPLVVAVKVATAKPNLLCLEQPELHMHPRAHVAIAELLLEYIHRNASAGVLVETHSDVLVLRIRREIAAGRLSSKDVKIYFVDEDATAGSVVKPVELDERATPQWWPKDVFGEPQREYFLLRQELVRRGLVA